MIILKKFTNKYQIELSECEKANTKKLIPHIISRGEVHWVISSDKITHQDAILCSEILVKFLII